MFAKQVSAHCKSTASEVPVAVCKRDLLVYGIGRLEKMSDIYLDTMDPYQRGVNDLSKFQCNQMTIYFTQPMPFHINAISHK